MLYCGIFLIAHPTFQPYDEAMKRLVFAFSFVVSVHGLFGNPVEVGFADRDISPEIGMERPGGYAKSYHQKFHDPCKARAAVFSSDSETVALVGLDALLIMEAHVAEARQEIHARTGIDPKAILIGASHSHSSGPTGMVVPGDFDHASPLVQDLAYEQSSCADPKYLKVMINGIVESVVEAYENRQPMHIGFASGEEGRVSFNRRWRMKNGLTFTHPRFGNPDMIEEAGPIDPEVGVIGAWDSEGKLAGCVVNFACHATTSPRGISANYPWALEKVIDGTFGEDTVVVFLNGNSGDVTQVDNSSPVRRHSGEAAAMEVGGSVGAEAVKLLVRMNIRTTEAAIAFKNETLDIPRRHPSPERLKKCLDLVQEKPTEPAAINAWIWAKEIVLLDALIAKQPVRPVEIQTIQIGPAVFVTNPAEYFCEFGLEIKARSHFPYTWPVSMANGCVGYVPTAEALSKSGGGYETRLTAYSNLVPEAGSRIREKSIEMANSMAPDNAPEGSPLPPFKAGWRYGDVPPELK